MALPIEDYALIGDRRTAALVGRNGSIDWLCLPRFDSDACLAALLGTEDHGHWQLCPVEEFTSERRYVDGSSVLETTFTTADGVITLTDLMPRGDGRADVVRRLTGVRGTVRIRHEWMVRLDYGKVRPWVRRREIGGEHVITAVGGPDQLILRGPRLPVATDHRHNDEFEVCEGDELVFSTTWLPSHVELDDLGDLQDRIRTTIDQDEEWASRCPADVPHADVVRRSLLTLRLLTHEQTGGIVAAPTTSLPEDFGGERNWDYRYCWLRDAALTLSSLIRAGYTEEADLWRGWLLRAVAGDPQDMQIMYAVDGARRLPEHTLDHLPGYAGSTPVRIGNGAVDQHQADVLGEVMIALEHTRTAERGPDDNAWALQRALVDQLARTWDRPDNGLWEIRGVPQRFTHSRVMVWAAFDRAVRAVEEHDLPGPVEEWRAVRDRVREEVLDKGFDRDRNTFTQHYATTEVDASLLVLPLVGFLDGDDPRVLGTIAAVEADLLRDGLVLRYRTGSGVDGLSGDEHPFLACSFWLVSAYAAAGRTDDAHALFDRLVGLVNDVGLLSEEYDVGEGRMAGNFPQAFSHLALVQAAFDLSATK
ncbi:GH15 family glucan-1,4-alpha-glucosidase [Nocardioides ginsengisegetis]|uniref:GH15 family glucan-1,4-alpha-glucosidase n=1 Tax=Nocardioides ginsengisegetis TaxID=661491 RepID=A0A7W3IYE8_9ACTN|nr:glycoside hydrolase family 15 protein [Nocardioides ginsengisegetis]MBA8802945.1 GH15 family glucan-1,4-alpha-glucosidase [Nocardioides ginsengisegetis]